jgi:protein ImuA
MSMVTVMPETALSPNSDVLAALKRRLLSASASCGRRPRLEVNLTPSSLWQPGIIGEWLAPPAGSGAMTLAWRSLAEWLPPRGMCAVIDPGKTCWAPAIAGWGIELRRLLVIHPTKSQEAWWAVEQSLRARGVAATCAWVDRVPERTLRRWQLAAEVGGGVGLLFRPIEARREPSWAEFRVLVTPLAASSGDARRVRLELLYRRGGLGGSAQVWELDHAESDMHLVPAVAHSTALRPAARA